MDQGTRSLKHVVRIVRQRRQHGVVDRHLVGRDLDLNLLPAAVSLPHGCGHQVEQSLSDLGVRGAISALVTHIVAQVVPRAGLTAQRCQDAHIPCGPAQELRPLGGSPDSGLVVVTDHGDEVSPELLGLIFLQTARAPHRRRREEPERKRRLGVFGPFHAEHPILPGSRLAEDFRPVKPDPGPGKVLALCRGGSLSVRMAPTAPREVVLLLLSVKVFPPRRSELFPRPPRV